MAIEFQNKWDEIAASVDEIIQDSGERSLDSLTEAQRHYVLAFRKIVLGMFCAARVIQTGLVSAKTPTSKVSSVLNMVSRMTPIGGSALFLLKCMVDKVDQAVMERRINRIASLGTMESEVATLADTISSRIVFSVHAKPHKASHGILASMLSLAEDVTAVIIGAVAADDIPSFQIETTLFDHMSNAIVDTLVADDELRVEEDKLMAKRGEKDANALIAALSKQNSVDLSTGKLFILAFPTATLLSDIYDELLRRFHNDNPNGQPLHFATTNVKKRKLFYRRLLTGFYCAANDVMDLLSDRDGNINPVHVFADAIAAIEIIQDGQQSVKGLFYWKDRSSIHSMHIGLRGVGQHTVGWNKAILDSDGLIPQVIRDAANSID